MIHDRFSIPIFFGKDREVSFNTDSRQIQYPSVFGKYRQVDFNADSRQIQHGGTEYNVIQNRISLESVPSSFLKVVLEQIL